MTLGLGRYIGTTRSCLIQKRRPQSVSANYSCVQAIDRPLQTFILNETSTNGTEVSPRFFALVHQSVCSIHNGLGCIVGT